MSTGAFINSKDLWICGICKIKKDRAPKAIRLPYRFNAYQIYLRNYHNDGNRNIVLAVIISKKINICENSFIN